VKNLQYYKQGKILPNNNGHSKLERHITNLGHKQGMETFATLLSKRGNEREAIKSSEKKYNS